MTAPRTWSVGEVVTAALMNQEVRDGQSLAYAILTRSSNQSIADTTVTAVQWNSESSDSDNGHDTVTNNSRYTFPYAGLFLVAVTVPWVNNATGIREVNFRINGSTSHAGDRNSPGANVTHVMPAFMLVVAAAADYVETIVWQTSTVALNIDQTYASGPRMSIACLRKL